MFLKNKNIIFKIRRSKVTDYAALIKRNLFIHILALQKYWDLVEIRRPLKPVIGVRDFERRPEISNTVLIDFSLTVKAAT